MFPPGTLVFFDPFHFKDGSPASPKFFLSLKIHEGKALLASLPSSQLHLPTTLTFSQGCVQIEDSCINCYLIEAGFPITKSGWSFQKPTVLYGQWLDLYDVSELQNNYPIAGVDYEIKGEILEEEFGNIIDCFSNSPMVKNKFRRILKY